MSVSIDDKTIIRLMDPWSPEFKNKKKKKKNSSSLNVWWVPKITHEKFSRSLLDT